MPPDQQDDTAAQAAPVPEAQPEIPTHVRMKHLDPEASISVGGEKDATGGTMVPMEHLQDAQDHGFYVCHTDDDTRTAEPVAEAGALAAADAPAATAAASGEPAKAAGEDDGKEDDGTGNKDAGKGGDAGRRKPGQRA